MFDCYVRFNFHVGLAVVALTRVTAFNFNVSLSFLFYATVFCIAFLGYNFIKFFSLYLENRFNKSKFFPFLFPPIIIALIVIFIGLSSFTYAALGLVFLAGILVLLYSIPLSKKRKNFRALRGLKIHLVALAWLIITFYLPLVFSEAVDLDNSIFLTVQRYVFVLVATLPFEIRDLNSDEFQLSTLPQKFGVRNTKLLGVILIIFHLSISFFIIKTPLDFFIIESFVLFVLMILILKSGENQSEYYSSFWVEGIPVLWCSLYILLR